ncbi:UDP-N-acetylmuramoyl-L-alanine--D-glutamate ligase [Candidatus Dependentiae bacterium]|nr:UDP-N-acetylmuramoyl-L-alanine--D-glutamate ligase [Candidatus Dependentiae bacterium]
MNLYNKKIGIWGLGVVGTSVLNYVKAFTNYVQILDKKNHPEIPVILQTPETVKKFLDENDYIIPSPGISLHNYQDYQHKFLCELDLFTPNYYGKTVAITGTAGKTTVTDFIAQSIPNSVAAGNIGFAMLDALKLEPKPTTIVLEVSSYQLQYANNFAPDIAIWTNFFPNHLDHHKNIDEYFTAKCNILRHQNNDQIAIVAHELMDKILDKIDYKGKLFTYSQNNPYKTDHSRLNIDSCPDNQENQQHITSSNHHKINLPHFYIENNSLVLRQNNQTTTVFKNIQELPQITFIANWIVIIATLYLNKQNLSQVNFTTIKPQQHRVEYVGKYHNIEIYNDSKSTIQESTQEALKKFTGKKIALIIGGMSKGADRSPLIQFMAKQKNIIPFIFGKEKEILTHFCEQHKVKYFASENLEHLLEIFKINHQDFDILLFSPAGSSFDQFKNYQDRGNIFKELVQKL